MSKPICLITGATDGVGKATAKALALRGFHVVLAARNEAKAKAVRAEIEATSGRDHVDVMTGDLASLTQVRKLADKFKTAYPKLDVLINNAGVMLPARQLTEDGFEAAFQINYLSAFLLTSLLLSRLMQSEQGRIINLSSSIYTLGKYDPHNLQGGKKYSAIGAYASSKLFMLLYSIELARRLAITKITANAVHPGVVRTQMLATAQGLFKVIALLATPFAVSPEKGARTSVHLASAPALAATSGLYFVNSKPSAVKSRFNTDEVRQGLWRVSAESVGVADVLNG